MGPLAGVKIIELAGIGPGPMAAMMLADLGATVLRIERREAVQLGVSKPLEFNLLLRNRQAIALDLKDPQAVELVKELLADADALIEGFRPGVTERLGLGPEQCLALNPRLVYGRITGWGQSGPLAKAAGHDINYIALTGVLNAIGRNDHLPAVPLALLGDMSGGALYLTIGVLAGIFEARRSGLGQVVDAAIVDGTASMATLFYGLVAAGSWNPRRGSNLLDSGAYFYDVYPCADNQLISIGPIEGRFHTDLLRHLDIDPQLIGEQNDPRNWPAARTLFTEAFARRTRAQWCELLEGTDVCFAPVLSFAEAPEHPHLKARGTFIEVDGVVQPAPAPRFSRTPPSPPTPPRAATVAGIPEALSGWLPAARIAHWTEQGVMGDNPQ
ncbi:CoA transferase [Pseudomonas sp. GD03860]|uniref:CaiB/BaiF CoA transferase family protein n=1 Tax=Pseudomonas TaxID=286 RepID=UPI0023635C5C|nr:MULTISPECIES: CaiB/BaiF CoA-transferase family protein [Pseudomonas]MDD2058660.1 CoA transferase [Pseudomonas putida]MDH0636893.1 CoA transferase [Pseudomonas sp. GD03860]